MKTNQNSMGLDEMRWGSLRGTVGNVLDSEIVVSEF